MQCMQSCIYMMMFVSVLQMCSTHLFPVHCHNTSTQDLLQLQYEGLAVMKMFGRAKINVNLLIHLINKKFYGVQK